jgi:hypothetical protein
MLKKYHFLNTFAFSWTQNRIFLYMKLRSQFNLERKAVTNNKNVIQNLEKMELKV